MGPSTVRSPGLGLSRAHSLAAGPSWQLPSGQVQPAWDRPLTLARLPRPCPLVLCRLPTDRQLGWFPMFLVLEHLGTQGPRAESPRWP